MLTLNEENKRDYPEFLAGFNSVLSSDYERRKVSKDMLDNGLKVSTAFTVDEGYETALIDINGVQPVERYKNHGDAVEGHKKWLEFAKTADGKVVIKLGCKELEIDDKEIIITTLKV